MSKITLLQSYDDPIFISSESEGYVYRISYKYVVKVPARERYKKDMLHEIKIARLLYSFGISVPEPITCDYVKINGEIQRGYIMEYIEGISDIDKDSVPWPVWRKTLETSKKLVKIEMEKSKKLGFSIPKEEPQWILSNDKKIKLIDFTQWKYEGFKCQY